MLEATVEQGRLREVDRGDHALFMGVPYAAPPVGELRFRAPQPARPWTGTRAADHFPPRCPHTDHEPGSFYQREFFYKPEFMPVMDEDCLYLNIWTPAKQPGAKLPVALWIHGGGFSTGSGCDYEFDGAALARAGIVTVTINYRLNVFGFLCHSWLTAESGHSGNYGLLDQIAALKWVRANIAAFGGDPDRITLFGQSAGALSVQALVSSPLDKGDVCAAIIQSAGGYDTGVGKIRKLSEAQRLGDELISAADEGRLPNDGRFPDDGRFPCITTLEQLRALPAMELMRLAERYDAAEHCLWPVIDGHVLPEDFDAAIDNAHTHDVPYMIGLTENDIGMTPEMLRNGEKSRLYRGCVEWSLRNERLGRKPSYVYYFTHKPLGDDAGAFHCAELWYMFGILNRSWRPKDDADYALEREMVAYWANFMRSGNPNGDGLPLWKSCSHDDPFVKVFI